MENIPNQTRAFEGVSPTSAGVRIETKQRCGETTYWGVLCRTCQGLVAFDVAPYVTFGPKELSLRPGAIRCGLGHNHIYFPRDFQFVSSALSIGEAAMRENRILYRAINSSGQPSSHDYVPEAVPPVANAASGAPAHGLEIVKTQPVSLTADPRREAAQAAAKKRWTNWAEVKVR